MRKIAAIQRRRRAHMATVQECIAHLHEELNLTAAFTGAMMRMGNYRAALGVVEEQSDRVRAIPAHVDRAVARPRRKARAAVAGLAAAALLGSGALAAWVSPNRSEAAPAIERLERAVDAIRAAEAAPIELRPALVAAATTALRGIDPKELPRNTLTPEELDDVVRILEDADKATAEVLAAAQRLVKRISVPQPPRDAEAPEPKVTPGGSPAPPGA